MLRDRRRATLPALRCFITGGTDDWQLMPTSAMRSAPPLDGLAVRHRVGRVRVAAPRRGDHVLAGARDPGIAFQVEPSPSR